MYLSIHSGLGSVNCVSEPVSSETSDSHLASFRCNSSQVISSEFFPVQSPADGVKSSSDKCSSYDISDVTEPSSYALCFSTPDFSNSLNSSHIHNVCDNVASHSSSELILNLGKVSHSMRKRIIVDDVEANPKIIKVQSVSTPQQWFADRQERRKALNKVASASLRYKKKMQEQNRLDEIAKLESEKIKKQEKIDALLKDFTILKSLVCDRLVANYKEVKPTVSKESLPICTYEGLVVNDDGVKSRITEESLSICSHDVCAVTNHCMLAERRTKLKKVQSTVASAKYRRRKRMKQEIISIQIANLESERKKLQSKIDALLTEIKCLKSFCEQLVTEGVMK